MEPGVRNSIGLISLASALFFFTTLSVALWSHAQGEFAPTPGAGPGVAIAEEMTYPVDAVEYAETETASSGESEGSGGETPAPAGDDRKTPRSGGYSPLLAVVIDDWGYGWEAAEDFLSLDVPINVAVIPYLPLSRTHAEAAFREGHQVLLHLPMEPLDDRWELVDGTVTTAMSDSAITQDVVRAIEAVPHASAINNHMGSKATADERVVRAVLAAAAEHGLYFLDSRTSSESVVAEVARELGAGYLSNDRFLDPDRNPERIRQRLILAARRAKERGWAVVIGHVRPETYAGLRAALDELQAMGVRLAYLEEVAERAGVYGLPDDPTLH